MTVTGLICEYNPLHNGHLYHIRQAREKTKADYLIVVMSGNFVQRGEPAIFPKHLRAKMALLCGADLVLELPACYATASGEYFSTGAVSLMQSLGCVDYLCFGSETGDLELLQATAKLLVWETEAYKNHLQAALKEGGSFPQAREQALLKVLQESPSTADIAPFSPGKDLPKALHQVLGKPNNILALEYLKALQRLNSTITPVTIPRVHSHYHDTEISGSICSATAVRRLLTGSGTDVSDTLAEENCLFERPPVNRPGGDITGEESELWNVVPPVLKQVYKDALYSHGPVTADDFSLLLQYRLMTESRETLAGYLDVSPALANRIANRKNDFRSWGQFCRLLHTKECTYGRISRCLTHILLGIPTAQSVTALTTQETPPVPYARVLGFEKDSTKLLSHLKDNSKIPLLTKLPSQVQMDSLSKVDAAKIGIEMLQQDIASGDLYQSVITHLYKIPFSSEYEKPVVIL